MESLRPAQGAIHRLLRDAHALGLSMKARERLRWFAFAVDHGCTVAETCQHFGIARSTLLKWLRRFDPHDPASLEERSRRPRRMRESQIDPAVVALIRGYRESSPTMGKERIQALLLREHGRAVSASTVGRVIAREGLYFAQTPAHERRRLRRWRGVRRSEPYLPLDPAELAPTELQLPLPFFGGGSLDPAFGFETT